MTGPLNIRIFQHVPYEDAGCIKSWCDENGHRVTYTRFYLDDPIPAPEDFDWLIIMGGPMGVYDEKLYPWLRNEKGIILQAIEDGKRVIGICLGAQLIASVLGARVYQNKYPETGWFDIRLTEEGRKNFLMKDFDPEFPVFHWHGDTFDLPEGAVHLASSAACRNQAFLFKNRVLGLQFHLEITENDLRAMMENGAGEAKLSEFCQSKGTLMEGKINIPFNQQQMIKILSILSANPGSL